MPKRPKRAARVPTAVQPPEPKDGLTPAQREFCLTYLGNGFNATQAYVQAYPGSSYEAARRSASDLLTLPDIRAFLKEPLEQHWKALQMDGEEALARIALLSTLDVGECFNEDGTLRPLTDWPALYRQCVESIDIEKGKVKVGSRLQALRTILEVGGKIKNPSADDAIRDLATILAEKFKA